MLAEGKHFYEMPFYQITTFPHFELDEFWHNARRSLVNIMMRPWWLRTWTVQEAVLPRKATVRLGVHSIDLQLFIDAYSNFINHLFNDECCISTCGKLWETRQGELSMYNAFAPVEALGQMQAYAQNKASRRNAVLMTDHLILAKRRSCTDPLDAIYGLLGLLPDGLYEGIAPNYSTTPASLYARATKALFKTQSSLRMLAWAVDPLNDAYSLPSWCLHWNHDGVPYVAVDPYKACGSFKEYTASISGAKESELVVEGILTGNVSKVGIAIQDRDSTWIVREIKNTVSSWDFLGYPTSTASANSFWRAVFLDRPIIKSIEKRRRGIRRMQPEDVEAAKTWWKWVLGLDEATNIAEIWPLPTNELADCQTTFLATHHRSNFFATEEGSIGCVSSRIQPGDQIFVVKGCPVPLALRQQDKHLQTNDSPTSYKLIGCCYLHGFMDGEAVTEQIQWTTLSLT